MEMKEIEKRAYSHFESGLHCAEVISKTVLEAFSDKPHIEVIKSASGFGGGIAGSTEELCGAFTGGVIALGGLLGREEPGEDMRDCGALIKDFKGTFKDAFGSLNCSHILQGFSQNGNHGGCVKLTAQATVMLADLLNAFEKDREIDVHAFPYQPRDHVELGGCPFSPGS
ncbi:MAG: C_GCAxxG_C_C family protein [Deltaproteobacteria bacterium]|nr:C_GCAxxG_C_C family protein [Deltaproteobacteria bacterium]